MRDITIKEIVEYAEKIELESYEFYKTALKIVSKGLKDLIKELADEEQRHYNSLRALLNDKALSRKDLMKVISMDKDRDEIVKVDPIDGKMSEVEILKAALQREKDTKAMYDLYLTFTDLSINVVKVFEDLSNQEQGHYNRIDSKLKKM